MNNTYSITNVEKSFPVLFLGRTVSIYHFDLEGTAAQLPAAATPPPLASPPPSPHVGTLNSTGFQGNFVFDNSVSTAGVPQMSNSESKQKDESLQNQVKVAEITALSATAEAITNVEATFAAVEAAPAAEDTTTQPKFNDKVGARMNSGKVTAVHFNYGENLINFKIVSTSFGFNSKENSSTYSCYVDEMNRVIATQLQKKEEEKDTSIIFQPTIVDGWTYQSMSSMSQCKHKSHEELRLEHMRTKTKSQPQGEKKFLLSFDESGAKIPCKHDIIDVFSMAQQVRYQLADDIRMNEDGEFATFTSHLLTTPVTSVQIPLGAVIFRRPREKIDTSNKNSTKNIWYIVTSNVLKQRVAPSLVIFQARFRGYHVRSTVIPQLKISRLKLWITQRDIELEQHKQYCLEQAKCTMSAVLKKIKQQCGKDNEGFKKINLNILAAVQAELQSTIGLSSVKKYIVSLFRDMMHHIVSQVDCSQMKSRHLVLSGCIGTGKFHSAALIAKAAHGIGLTESSELHILRMSNPKKFDNFEPRRVNLVVLEDEEVEDRWLAYINQHLVCLKEKSKQAIVIFAGRNKASNEMLIAGLDELMKREPLRINLPPLTLIEMAKLVLVELEKERSTSSSINVDFIAQILQHKWSQGEREARNIYCVKDAVEYVLSGQRAEVAERAMGVTSTSTGNQPEQPDLSLGLVPVTPSSTKGECKTQIIMKSCSSSSRSNHYDSVVLHPSHFFTAMGTPLSLSMKPSIAAEADNMSSDIIEKLNREKEKKMMQAKLEKQQQERQTVDKEISTMIGLSNVKSYFDELRAKIAFVEAGGDPHNVVMSGINYNMILTGPPGSGKTTVARLMHKFYKAYGLLKKDIFLEHNALELQSQYCGGTAPKVKGIVTAALGGTLFLDEAYSLSGNSGSDKFSTEAVRSLLTNLENNRGGIVAILAGYRDKMCATMRSDPGLQRRFPLSLHLEKYSEHELVDIIEHTVQSKYKMCLEENLRLQLVEALTSRYQAQMHSHNAGLSIQLVEAAITRYASRMGRLARTNPELCAQLCQNVTVPILTASDFDIANRMDILIAKAQKKKKHANQSCSDSDNDSDPGMSPEDLEQLHREEMKQTAMIELENMIGFEDAKKYIQSFVNKVKLVQRGASKKILQTCMNLVLQGNPGTGKTTLARILHKIMYAWGIIRKNVFVEKNALDLKGTHCGQTAPKVQLAFSEAEGGTLFLDEAWALKKGDTFSTEAIATLLTELERNRTNVFVVIAGYQDKMQDLLDSDPGLRRRFPKQLTLPDYTPNELAKIASFVTKHRFDMNLDVGVERKIQNLIHEKCFNSIPKLNASLPIQMVENAIGQMAERLCTEDILSEAAYTTLIHEDFQII